MTFQKSAIPEGEEVLDLLNEIISLKVSTDDVKSTTTTQETSDGLKTPGIYHVTTDKSSILGSPAIEPLNFDKYHPSKGHIYEYNYTHVHNDLEHQIYSGAYGWDNACYYGIAEKRAGVDLRQHFKKRTIDEYYLPGWIKLLEHPKTKEWWPRIVTFDPLGMTATNPTIAATNAIINLPDFTDLVRDGKIVDADGGVNITKAAVYYSWNIPALAERLKLSEADLRDALFRYTGNPKLYDQNIRTFLPPVGGVTIYVFGDVEKIRDETTEIAVRVHDECNGSDVFCTDICTCRPYLIFAIRACIECAQRGGVGVIAYFRKEGRSLGEVTKFRVYNARKNQDGGDRMETYFYQTENIAGIRDARFQTMMPDVLCWMGINRIDWLLSMSNEKYEAIIEAGITVNQRVPLPDFYIPKHAHVEVNAKIASGYHADEVKTEEAVDALRQLSTIRTQCRRLFKLAKSDQLTYWRLNINRFDHALELTKNTLERMYPDGNIKMHSRFRHFDQSVIDKMMHDWQHTYYVENKERVRRLVDLITVSVLLDAGAGHSWKYIDARDNEYSRSEGLAMASLDMFTDGLFSSDPALKTRVNSLGLKQLTVQKIKVGFQVTNHNSMVGIEGRCKLLQRLGSALEKHPEFFGREIFRPGNMLDYLLRHANDKLQVSIHVLWRALMVGFESIWPKQMSGIRRGDVWVHNKLKRAGYPGSDMVPFHKLQQWLCLSLVEAFQYYGLTFVDMEAHTCLAEYRNGGLFVDTGVLQLKKESDAKRCYDVGSELVVEWRALTVVLCDIMAARLRTIYGKSEKELPLNKVLEGTWKSGRELAHKLRENGTSPINLRSDGTVF